MRLAFPLSSLLAMTLLGGCDSVPSPDGSRASVFSLKSGDCLNDAGSESTFADDAAEVGDMRRLDCAQPHLYEVYEVYRMDEAQRPDDGAVELLAETVCESRFQSFVGLAYEDSEFGYFTLWPSESSWRLHKDRDIVCMLGSVDGKTPLVGSMRDARR